MLDLFDFDSVADEVDQSTPDSKSICQFSGDKNEILKKYFGFDSFRLGQQEIIDTIINDEECKGVLAVMATGAGKSLLFQLPAMMSNGLTIVVSPLISLMKDQVDSMVDKGMEACTINSTMTDKQVDDVMSNLGDCKLLYVSPERFKNEDFVNSIVRQRIGLFAVDEAHCISQWGHDFRLSYSKLKEAIKSVSPARVVALTATATPEVQEDICRQLNMENAHKFVRGTYRSNLKISINQCSEDNKIRSVTNRLEKLIYKLRDDGVKNPTGIIYTATKKYAEVISRHLNGIGYRATFYHGGLGGKARTNIQDGWAKNGGIIVATCAFGMGIDRPDVRFVFHCGLTGSISEWWQMIGRSGRDGKEALCMTFFDQTPDYELQMFLLNMTNPTASDIKRFWKWLLKFAYRQVEPGAKTTVVNLTQKEMSSKSGCYNVGSIVSFLKKRNLISTLGRGKYRVMLKNPEFDFAALDELRKKNIMALNNVLDFFRSDCCRMAYICEHYGDTTFVGRCEGCDWCRKNQGNLT